MCCIEFPNVNSKPYIRRECCNVAKKCATRGCRFLSWLWNLQQSGQLLFLDFSRSLKIITWIFILNLSCRAIRGKFSKRGNERCWCRNVCGNTRRWQVAINQLKWLTKKIISNFNETLIKNLLLLENNKVRGILSLAQLPLWSVTSGCFINLLLVDSAYVIRM